MVKVTQRELNYINKLSKQVVDSAYQVHNTLGPGLLEKAYQQCLIVELNSRGINCKEEVYLPIVYKGKCIDSSFRIDLLIENKIILELKSIETLLPIHEAQLITYLKLSKVKLGFLINFNVKYFKDGIKRIIN